MARPVSDNPRSKEMRVVFTPSAYERVIAQALRIDQTPASFARQIIMEKVILLESAGANADVATIFGKLQETMTEIERMEKMKEKPE